MRKILFFMLFPGIAFLFIQSCNKDDDNNNPPIYVFPSGAVADYIGSAFSSSTSGINYHMENAAMLAKRTYVTAVDSSFERKKLDSAATTKYNYLIHYTFGRLAGNPPEFYLDLQSNGSFSTPVVNSTGQLNSSYTISGLEVSAPSYTMKGSGTDGGDQLSKQYNNVVYTCSFTYTLKDVLMDKISYKVISGTASIRASGVGPASVPFSYSGTLTFLGNRLATLVLAGVTYDVNLQTGTISK